MQNTVVASMLVTQQGSELVSWDSPVGGTISIARNHGPAKVLVSGDPAANRTQLVQQPTGAIQLYYPNAQGVGRLTSTDDGQTWSANVQTQSHTTGPVMAAAVAADGTPYFAQDSTAGVNVFRGLNGEYVKNVFPRCCGYAESLAVDTAGLVQVAFFSNATADGTFLYERLGADLTPAGTTELKPTGQHRDRVPLVADKLGNTFLAWPPGSPDATSLTRRPVPERPARRRRRPLPRPVHGRRPAHGARARRAGPPLDRLDGRRRGARGPIAQPRRALRSTVSVAVPGTMDQVSAAGIDGSPGSVDVVVNTGANLLQQSLQPGLSVVVSKTTKKVGKKKVVTHWAQALDDGFPVPTASFRIGGRTFHANAQGKAKVPVGSGKASAPGYVGANVRIR